MRNGYSEDGHAIYTQTGDVRVKFNVMGRDIIDKAEVLHVLDDIDRTAFARDGAEHRIDLSFGKATVLVSCLPAGSGFLTYEGNPYLQSDVFDYVPTSKSWLAEFHPDTRNLVFTMNASAG